MIHRDKNDKLALTTIIDTSADKGAVVGAVPSAAGSHNHGIAHLKNEPVQTDSVSKEIHALNTAITTTTNGNSRNNSHNSPRHVLLCNPFMLITIRAKGFRRELGDLTPSGSKSQSDGVSTPIKRAVSQADLKHEHNSDVVKYELMSMVSKITRLLNTVHAPFSAAPVSTGLLLIQRR
jgi:hypothetical protein